MFFQEISLNKEFYLQRHINHKHFLEVVTFKNSCIFATRVQTTRPFVYHWTLVHPDKRFNSPTNTKIKIAKCKSAIKELEMK